MPQQATNRRSSIARQVIHDKPKFIKRTRDKMWFSNLETMSEILEAYHFTADRFVEEDGTVTLSLNEIDLKNIKNYIIVSGINEIAICLNIVKIIGTDDIRGLFGLGSEDILLIQLSTFIPLFNSFFIKYKIVGEN